MTIHHISKFFGLHHLKVNVVVWSFITLHITNVFSVFLNSNLKVHIPYNCKSFLHQSDLGMIVIIKIKYNVMMLNNVFYMWLIGGLPGIDCNRDEGNRIFKGLYYCENKMFQTCSNFWILSGLVKKFAIHIMPKVFITNVLIVLFTCYVRCMYKHWVSWDSL